MCLSGCNDLPVPHVKGKTFAMKTLSFWLVVAVVAGAGCHKSGAGSGSVAPAMWGWVESDWNFGAGSGVSHPGPDTSIVITMEQNNQYAVSLNGKVISSGSYTSQFGTDSTITFSGNLAATSEAAFGLGGRYIFSTSATSDTITLASDPTLITPAGASTTMKFVGLFNPGGPAVPGQ
jgi:hypothetical protein